MLLAIDSGNTNAVFAVFDGERRLGMWRCATHPGRTADEYAAFLLTMLRLSGLASEAIKHAIIGSVVPDSTWNLKQLCRRHFNCVPMVVGEGTLDYRMQILLDQPQEVGADRVVNSVAAKTLYRPPLMVIDFGTATTFDVVDADGHYRGGVIAPGVNLSLEALHRAAAKLPRVDIRAPERVIGTSTVTAMQSGVFWGYVSMIEGLIGRIQQEFSMPMRVIATGGLAPLFAGGVKAIEIVDEDLTVKGLALLWKINQGHAHEV